MSVGRGGFVRKHKEKKAADPMLETSEAALENNSTDFDSSSSKGLADKVRDRKMNRQIDEAKTILGKEIDEENKRLEEERRKVMSGEILSSQKRKRLASFGRAGTMGGPIGMSNAANRRTVIGS